MKFKPCDSGAAAELVMAQRELIDKVGISGLGTPMFMIDGQAVRGFNMPQIEKILGAKK
ncbi:MAG: DsbA family protein [Syntrophales bacterium]